MPEPLEAEMNERDYDVIVIGAGSRGGHEGTAEARAAAGVAA